ncbi:MAG TPA: hypothetical protein VKS79_11170 [Gemmataceae bacterium]|nr:hypothetical protein [Gemmataceae bacterium]
MLLLIGLLYAAWPGSSTFTVSPETTYATGPIDKEGYVDYVTAVNERLRGNIKPEENANVLIWQALGPHPEGANMPAEYFEWLGAPQPSEAGEYWVSFISFLTDHLKEDFPLRRDELYDREARAMKWPWLLEDEPQIAEWLKLNQKPIAVIREASRRSEYFNPLVPKGRTEEWTPSLLSSLLPNVQLCREVVAILCIEAMLRLEQGNIEGAWEDLLTSHRLSRLLQRGGTLIEMLVGIATEMITVRAELTLLDKGKVTSQQTVTWWRQIQGLPPMSPVVEKLELTERLTFLQTVMLMARYGPAFLESLTESRGGPPPNSSGFRVRFFSHSVNYDPAFRYGNHCFDRLAVALRLPDRGERQNEIAGIIAEIKTRRTEAASPETFIKKEIWGPKFRGEKIGDILVGLLLPAFNKLVDSADRLEQTYRNLHLAFALAAYHADHHRYPETLAELAPKFIDKIPDDLFSGQPLIYRLEGDGYLLYSVGVNGIDDGGQGYDDDPKGDDLVVRMPVPEPKLKKAP